MPVGESRYMEPLQLAGRLIMENGGETYPVRKPSPAWGGPSDWIMWRGLQFPAGCL